MWGSVAGGVCECGRCSGHGGVAGVRGGGRRWGVGVGYDGKQGVECKLRISKRTFSTKGEALLARRGGRAAVGQLP